MTGPPPIRLVDEWAIDDALHASIEELLTASFAGYPSRSHFKVPPHARLLVLADDRLVGHAGIDRRVVRVGDQVVRTCGIVDLCVAADHRSHGIATRLVEEAAAYAARGGADHLLLFADRHDLYRRAGFTLVDAPCTWTRIDEHRTLGIATDTSLGDCMMVRPVGRRPWPEGPVDLLGHVF